MKTFPPPPIFLEYSLKLPLEFDQLNDFRQRAWGQICCIGPMQHTLYIRDPTALEPSLGRRKSARLNP